MNQPLTDFERMVDAFDRPLVWKGRWVFENRYGGVSVFDRVVLPATFPREYYHR